MLQTVPAQGKGYAYAIYSPSGTAQLNGSNIEANLRHLFERLLDPYIDRTEEMPWASAGQPTDLMLAA